MTPIKNVAVFGASGNFGVPITAALQQAGFTITIITRAESTSTFPPGLRVLTVDYTSLEALTTALTGQDAVVMALSPAAAFGSTNVQNTIIDAVEAAGTVQRVIVNDFGWGPDIRSLPEFDAVRQVRKVHWDYAKMRSEGSGRFTWTGISCGNPIDWALQKFPILGFTLATSTVTIYDHGTEYFTGTTLEGIGQSVVGVLHHPDETANRFVKTLSIKTNQTELLQAFESATKTHESGQDGNRWTVEHSTVQTLLERGRLMLSKGNGQWRVNLLVAQMFEEGQARCVLAPSWEQSDSSLLGVRSEPVEEVVAKALGLQNAPLMGVI
ncbi:hypothetical protein BD289DRAFT_479967 [Coniella lustricola]|uniref:NAD(P)-binding domain-containing protein n=1 Tax=Coniella lustricola TaxID=2025994 RepID=A0A2T3AHK3_9PEZI|nr:hypothetical protein BD289DRAFT_479967 [Coniella lustricola]